MRQTWVTRAVLAGVFAAACAASGETCSLRPGQTEGKLSFSWENKPCGEGRDCHSGDSDMPWSRWSGVTPSDLQHEGASLDAHMKAEAGEIRCAGEVHGGALRGTYSFAPDAGFARRMESMGFTDLTAQRLQGYAMLDVTTGWVKSLQDAHVAGMTSESLMGLRALRVDAPFVEAMSSAGYPELRAQKLTAMKAVGVTPEKVREIRAMGYSPSEEELIQMSVFKIDPPFVQRMKARGFKDLSIAQLVKIKVFKLDE